MFSSQRENDSYSRQWRHQPTLWRHSKGSVNVRSDLSLLLCVHPTTGFLQDEETLKVLSMPIRFPADPLWLKPQPHISPTPITPCSRNFHTGPTEVPSTPRGLRTFCSLAPSVLPWSSLGWPLFVIQDLQLKHHFPERSTNLPSKITSPSTL